MRRVFADSGFYIALLSRQDAHHHLARQQYREGQFGLFVTTTAVLGELANLLSSTSTRGRCEVFIVRLRARKDTRIIESEPGQFWRGLKLYGERPDKEWSLTDCISFIVMSDEGLTEALTGDHHFEQAGFTALLLH